MNARRLFLLLALSVVEGLGHGLKAESAALVPAEMEQNGWPFLVRQTRPVERRVDAWSGAGPFLFRKPDADLDHNTASGFRPFWVQVHNPAGEFRAGYALYPLFSYTVDENTYKWSVFELIRHWDRRPGAGAPSSVFDQRGEFEIFPLWFSRQSGDPALSYRALFPVYGTIKNKLFFERLSWVLFPLYVESEKRGGITTFAPWPVVRLHRGATRGWGVWPLYDHVERPGVSKATYVLWPLLYNVTRQPHRDDPAGTPARRDVGALPFWARSTGPGYVNQDFAWPFFGYTERTSPKRYSERRYFWPFLVQGRGEDRYVSRYAPFYTHSRSSGVDKQWFLWPLVRRADWTDEGVARERTQFLYFLYWNEQQRAAGRPDSPAAELTHVWPLVSRWDSGAGRRQWQFPSPLEVFFPHNDKIRHAWSPLFALARHDQRAPGDSRTSLLWNAVTWEQRAAEERSEFHLGPLLSVARHADERRIAIGNGIFGFKRDADRRWRPFWLDFPAKSASSTPALR